MKVVHGDVFFRNPQPSRWKTGDSVQDLPQWLLAHEDCVCEDFSRLLTGGGVYEVILEEDLRVSDRGSAALAVVVRLQVDVAPVGDTVGGDDDSFVPAARNTGTLGLGHLRHQKEARVFFLHTGEADAILREAPVLEADNRDFHIDGRASVMIPSPI